MRQLRELRAIDVFREMRVDEVTHALHAALIGRFQLRKVARARQRPRLALRLAQRVQDREQFQDARQSFHLGDAPHVRRHGRAGFATHLKAT